MQRIEVSDIKAVVEVIINIKGDTDKTGTKDRSVRLNIGR